MGRAGRLQAGRFATIGSCYVKACFELRWTLLCGQGCIFFWVMSLFFQLRLFSVEKKRYLALVMGCPRLAYDKKTSSALRVAYRAGGLKKKVEQGLLSLDPDAHKYPYISPYNFVENAPIMLIDPNGKGPINPRTWNRVSTTVMAFKGINIISTGPDGSTGPYAYDATLDLYSGLLNTLGNTWDQLAEGYGKNFAPKPHKINPSSAIHRSTDGKSLNVEGRTNIGGKLAIRDAANLGNYVYKESQGKDAFNVTEVQDGIISKIYQFNRQGEEFDITEITEFQYEFVNERTEYEDYEDKTIEYSIRDVLVTETKTNIKTGKKETKEYLHERRDKRITGTDKN